MPTLFRFLFFTGACAAMVYAAMLALVVFVEPGEREITIRIPPGSLAPGPE